MQKYDFGKMVHLDSKLRNVMSDLNEITGLKPLWNDNIIKPILNDLYTQLIQGDFCNFGNNEHRMSRPDYFIFKWFAIE